MILWYGMICSGLGILMISCSEEFGLVEDTLFGRVRLLCLVDRLRNGGIAYLCTETPIRSFESPGNTS